MARTAAGHLHASSNFDAGYSLRGPASRVSPRKSGVSVHAPHAVSIGEDGGRAALLVDGIVQSISPLDGLIDGGYWAAMVPADRIRRALILGLGGGTLTRLLQARWADLHMVGVDDDLSILTTAHAVGWLPPAGLEIVTADAFEYVQSCQQTFDYVAVDLFRGERLAGRAFGKPFLRRVRELVEPHGRLAFNMFQDQRAPYRIERIGLFFDIREQVEVGGNMIVHARRRRP